MTTDLNLPFEHKVIGYLNACGRSFVAVTRDHPYHPFCVFELGIPHGIPRKQPCYHGGYHETRIDAFADLTDRALSFLRR